MESRAKQRLTGAVILVALFVLLVPELLTGPRDAHPPTADDSGDEGLRRYTIDLDAQDGNGQPMAPASNDAPVALPEVAAPMSATPQAATPATSAAAPAPAPAPQTAPQPAPPVSANPMAPTNNLAAAAPRTEPGTFVVQLGSFGSRENAERLVRDMTAKGFATFIAPITSNGRELYRVRVGPTRDRASAEALAAELKRVGQSGSIVPIS
jgi:DedD protein